MHYLGNLRKMVANLADDVQYSLVLNEQLINLNQYIGKDLTLRHTGKINCIAVKKVISKGIAIHVAENSPPAICVS